jgi:hypothetical protein
VALRIRKVCVTGSGWCCLWDRDGLHHVTSETWEDELLMADDVSRHIHAGALIPVNGFSDGGYDIEVRVGGVTEPETLPEREQRHVRRTSPPFLLRSGGTLCMSGIEFAMHPPGEHVAELRVPPGSYVAIVHDLDGERAPDLPSFLVLLNPHGGESTEFAADWYTFADDRPPTSGYLGVRISHTPNVRATAQSIREITDRTYSTLRDQIRSNEPIMLGHMGDPCANQLVVMLRKVIEALDEQGVGYVLLLDDKALTRAELGEVLRTHGLSEV